MENIIRIVERRQGYTGKGRVYERGYVAQITGLSQDYGLARTFLRWVSTTYNYGKGSRKQCWAETYSLGEGLYEVSEGGEKTYVIVYAKNGDLTSCTTCLDRAKKMADGMAQGLSFESARLATRKQPASQ